MNIFIHGEFASLNKNNTIGDYREEVKKDGYVQECKLTDVIVLDSYQWEVFTHSFMYDNSLIAGLGGTGSHYVPSKEYDSFYSMPECERKQWIDQAYNLGVLVINGDTKESIIVDPQGHNYARYVAFTDSKEVETLVNGYIKLYQNYKEIEQLEKEINKDIDMVVEIAREEVKKVTEHQEQTQEAEMNVQEEVKPDPQYTLEINLNDAKKGIEITPRGTLPSEVKDNLKQNGFSWFGGLKKYLAKQNPSRLEFIKTLQTV